MNYEERDSFGIYAAATALDDTVPNRNRGPGPHLMGADTLLDNDVVNAQDEDLGGIKEMNGLPDALFVIDVGYHKIAITEAAKLGIPIIAVVDTNHSPDNVAYVIPGNDDSSRAIRLYARGAADAILEGRNQVVREITGDEFVEVETTEESAAQ